MNNHSLVNALKNPFLLPTLLPPQLLAEPIWYLDRKGELPKGMQPYFMIPIVNYHEVRLGVCQ